MKEEIIIRRQCQNKERFASPTTRWMVLCMYLKFPAQARVPPLRSPTWGRYQATGFPPIPARHVCRLEPCSRVGCHYRRAKNSSGGPPTQVGTTIGFILMRRRTNRIQADGRQLGFCYEANGMRQGESESQWALISILTL